MSWAWRSWDRPRPGSVYSTPDDFSLQRSYTFTYMPDGRMVKVPAMMRQDVRAQSESHKQDESHDIVQALQDLVAGRKPVPGRARFNRHGRAHGNRILEHPGIRGGGPVHRQHEQLRPAVIPPLNEGRNYRGPLLHDGASGAYEHLVIRGKRLHTSPRSYDSI